MSIFHKINLDWDFSQRTKELYFNTGICLTGGNYCVDLQNLYNFYEITPLQDSNIFISEAVSQLPLLSEANKFIYIKNNGICNLFICAAHACETGFFDYKLTSDSSGSFCNIKLNAKEGILLCINTDKSGYNYYSSFSYPLGFFYSIFNLQEVYPKICQDAFYINYSNSCNIKAPVYIYSDTGNLASESLDESSNQICLINNSSEHKISDYSKYLDGKSFRFTGQVDSYIQLELNCSPKLSVTGKKFTIETIFNSSCCGGTLFSKGGGMTNWSNNGHEYLSYISQDSYVFSFRDSSLGNNTDSISICLCNNLSWSGYNNWNYLAISSDGCKISIWLNGQIQCSKNLNTGTFNALTEPAFFRFGKFPNQQLPFSGYISNFRFVSNDQINPNDSGICNPLNDTYYKCYWNNVSGTQLLVNFREINGGSVSNVKDFSFSKNLSENSCVCINFGTGFSGAILQNLKLSSYEGTSIVSGNLNISSVSLKGPNFFNQNIYSTGYSIQVNNSCDYVLIYDVDFSCCKFLKYNYLYSGEQDLCFSRILSNLEINLSGNGCCFEVGCIYSFYTPKENQLTLCINLPDFF